MGPVRSLSLHVFALLHFGQVVVSTFFETGNTIKVNGIDYWAPPHIVDSVPAPTGHLFTEAVRNGLTPIVVISTNRTLSAAGIEMAVDTFKDVDDVYQPGFPEGNCATT
jgi:hypothetical protein